MHGRVTSLPTTAFCRIAGSTHTCSLTAVQQHNVSQSGLNLYAKLSLTALTTSYIAEILTVHRFSVILSQTLYSGVAFYYGARFNNLTGTLDVPPRFTEQ